MSEHWSAKQNSVQYINKLRLIAPAAEQSHFEWTSSHVATYNRVSRLWQTLATFDSSQSDSIKGNLLYLLWHYHLNWPDAGENNTNLFEYVAQDCLL